MIRFEIVTEDRLGITVEILEKIYKKNINLISLEVFKHRVCVKIDHIDNLTKEELINELYSIDCIKSIKEMELLYHEQNERQLLAVINSVDEGIISIDRNYKINIFNDYCESLFGYDKTTVKSTDIRDILIEPTALMNLFELGEEYDNVEFRGLTKDGEISFISTGRCIKNDNNETIGAVISIKDVNKARELAQIVSSMEDGAFKDIIGNSDSIEKVKKIALAISKSNSTVLLRGESGTGKELFAKAIHRCSSRKNKNFVAINCAALPEALIESELFGYEKGSFTGAMQGGKNGLFKEAHGGTLFLDEIGELTLPLQAKLLRVLQEGKIRKIGSNKEESVDVRIIAATNRNLEEMIKGGQFREDLYYRINVIPIYLPSLKDRMVDIPALVQFFINSLNKKINRHILGADLNFIDKLMNYPWPGNVRELQNVIERAMNLCSGEYLTEKDLIMDFGEKNEGYEVKIISEKKNQFLTLKEELDIKEKEILIKVLKECNSYRQAAKILGVSHTTIMNKIKKFNIKL